jgi:hypothetical protein
MLRHRLSVDHASGAGDPEGRSAGLRGKERRAGLWLVGSGQREMGTGRVISTRHGDDDD